MRTVQSEHMITLAVRFTSSLFRLSFEPARFSMFWAFSPQPLPMTAHTEGQTESVRLYFMLSELAYGVEP